MLNQGVLTQKFGNVKVKVWPYPKEILRSLIIGLKQDSNTLHKITNVMGFKHSNSECYCGCNCKDKIESISLKFSLTAHRYGKVFIPLEVLDSDSTLHHTFLCELKPITDPCSKHFSKAINVTPGNVNNDKSCLLKLMYDENRCTKEEKFEINSVIHCHDTQQKNPGSTNEDACDQGNKKPFNIQKIIDLCSQFQMPSEEIKNLLKSFHCLNQKEKACSEKSNRTFRNYVSSKCEEKLHASDVKLLECNENLTNPFHLSNSRNNNRDFRASNYHHKNSKYCTKTRSPSPNSSYSCNEDYETDYSRSASPDNVCSEIQNSLRSGNENSSSCLKRCRHQTGHETSLMIEKDIHDIKCILKKLICLMHENPNGKLKNNHPVGEYNLEFEDCKSGHGADVRHPTIEKCLKKHLNICSHQHRLEENKCDDNWIINHCEDVDSNLEMTQSDESDRNQIYKSLPENIPVIPKADDQVKVPTLDAYDKNSVNVNEQPTSQSSTLNNEAQTLAIKTALETVGIPPHICEQICQLTFSGNGTGVTNIYYYVSSENGGNLEKIQKLKENSGKETEIIIEQQTMNKVDKNETESPEGNYSHIVVDFNNLASKDEHYKPNEIVEKESKLNTKEGSKFENGRRSLKRVKQAKFENNCSTKKNSQKG